MILTAEWNLLSSKWESESFMECSVRHFLRFLNVKFFFSSSFPNVRLWITFACIWCSERKKVKWPTFRTLNLSDKYSFRWRSFLRDVLSNITFFPLNLLCLKFDLSRFHLEGLFWIVEPLFYPMFSAIRLLKFEGSSIWLKHSFFHAFSLLKKFSLKKARNLIMATSLVQKLVKGRMQKWR